MARYVQDYQGIPGRPGPARGMDPNYRGVYGGMRMQGGEGQAEYGRYRLHHAGDLGGAGGFSGAEHPRRLQGPMRRGYDRGWGGGGVLGSRNPRLLHDFNANSPALRDRGGYDAEYRARRDAERWEHVRRNRFGYANRGLSDGGYSEGWAWGPMRGSR